MQTTRDISAMALIIATLSVSMARAAPRNWNTGNGNWNTAANWSPTPNAVPQAGDVVSIGFTDNTARTITYNYPGPAVTLQSLGIDLQSTNASTITFNQAANALSATNQYVGYFGKGTFNQTGGMNNASSQIRLGENAGSSGTYSVSNMGSVSTGHFVVGVGGQGVLNVSNGGFVSSINGTVGSMAASVGQVNISGALAKWIVNDDLNVGSGGTGTITIGSEGELYVADQVIINGSSAITLNGGRLRVHAINVPNRVSVNSGTVILSGNRSNNDPLITGLFGSQISTGKSLEVEQGFVLDGTRTISGGSVTVGANIFVGNGSNGEMEIKNGGTLVSAGGGIGVNYPTALLSEGHVRVVGAGSKWTHNSHLTVGSALATDTVLASSLVIEDQAEVRLDGPIAVHNESFVTLNGGTLRFGGIARSNLPSTGIPNGKFNFYAGTIQLIGDRVLGADSTINELFNGVIAAGKNLIVEGMASTSTAMAVDGGVLTVGTLGDAQLLQLQRGTLHILDGVLTVGEAGQLGATLDVNDDMIVNIEDGITNQGLVTGDGEVGGSFFNASFGELRAEPGKSLKLTGANNTNGGRINLLGGQIEFTENLTNTGSVTAIISGNGTLIARTGLTNNGRMNFAGTTNIMGDVTNSASGRIVSGGGGATIFYDDVVNNGEIRTSTNGFSVFFGSVSGGGMFTGTGTVNFEGDLSPGSSPATVNFGGDVVLGADATLAIEIGGTTPGSGYDRINVAGQLSLGGTLEISLINGFVPTAGQVFDFIVGSNIIGGFSSISLPTIPGLTWDTSQILSGVLSAAAGLAGDYNQNGIVDAADYTVWRNHLGSGTALANDDTPGVDQDDYTRWKNNFGQTSGGSSGSFAVPEPNSLLLATGALSLMFVRRQRPTRPAAVGVWLLVFGLCPPPGSANRASAAIEYTVTDLGVLNGVEAIPHAINNFGQVVGLVAQADHSVSTFLWTPTTPHGTTGSMIDIGSSGVALSDNGKLASWEPLTPNGTVGGHIDLNVKLDTDDSIISESLNDFGQLTGSLISSEDGTFRGFLWTPSSPGGTTGTVTDLKPTETPIEINAIGQITGIGTVDGNERAFLWTPTLANGTSGSSINLGLLDGHIGNGGYDINSSGQVVGYSASNTELTPMLWTPTSPNATTGTMISLGNLGGSYGVANGINDQGDVVGGAGGAFLYQHGRGMVDLEALIDPQLGWALLAAMDINNAGQIAVIGSTIGPRHALLLTPINLLPGDYNQNGTVDAADYTVWRDHLGAPAWTLPNDVDGGAIGTAQYATWKANYGSTVGGGALTIVPEPGTMVLLILAATGWLFPARQSRASAEKS